jgi:hypothetical protein
MQMFWSAISFCNCWREVSDLALWDRAAFKSLFEFAFALVTSPPRGEVVKFLSTDSRTLYNITRPLAGGSDAVAAGEGRLAEPSPGLRARLSQRESVYARKSSQNKNLRAPRSPKGEVTERLGVNTHEVLSIASESPSLQSSLDAAAIALARAD